VKGFLANDFFKEKTEEEWKEIPLNIGVIGNSGVGKSSFINAIRRLTADDEGAAAPVGLTETTTEIQAYSHPDNPQLKFWDLPGVGTPNFPKDKYLECIGFDQFDFFLLLSATRFTENDAWLGREISAKNKKYYYVRTKIDNDMENNKKAHPRTHDESKELVKVREASRVLLGSDSTPVFLIDNYEPQKYDFRELEESLIVNFPELKRSALVFSVRAFSTRVVQMKVKELRSRMWKVSLLSGAVAAVPFLFRLPGVWDERTPRGQFRGRLIKQIRRITLIIIVMFPVCVVCVTLCYMSNLCG
jgi:interferon gamma inducible protein 47